MKNLFKVFGVIALVAIVGFSFAACNMGNDDDTTETEDPKWPDELFGEWETGIGSDHLTLEIMRNTYSDTIYYQGGYGLALTKIEGDVFTCQNASLIYEFTMTVDTDGKLTITSIVNRGTGSDGWERYDGKTYTRVTE